MVQLLTFYNGRERHSA